MKLLIDAGNSRIKLMLSGQHNVLTPVQAEQINWSTVSEVLLSSVADSALLQALLQQAAHWQLPVHQAVVTPKLSGLLCGYQAVETLGIDRWLGVAACYAEQATQHSIIVDAGTALTIDVLQNTGQHLGGWIIPGLKLSEQTLCQRSDKITVNHTTRATRDFATNTSNAVKNGILAASIGAIVQASTQVTGEKRIIITGGDGLALHTHLKGSHYRPNLVFEGLLAWRALTLSELTK